jgi:hypothetical protein
VYRERRQRRVSRPLLGGPPKPADLVGQRAAQDRDDLSVDSG